MTKKRYAKIVSPTVERSLWDEYLEDSRSLFLSRFSFPEFNPGVWDTRKDWYESVINQGYYWVAEYYTPDGEPR